MADQDVRNLFDSLDLNNNGVLTRGELITALRVKAQQQGGDIALAGFQNLQQIADFFAQADADASQEITFDEFATELSRRQNG